MLTQRGLTAENKEQAAVKPIRLVSYSKPTPLQSAIQQNNGEAIINALTNLYFENYQRDYRKPNLSKLLSSEVRHIHESEIDSAGELNIMLDTLSQIIRLWSEKIANHDFRHSDLANSQSDYLSAIDLLVKLRYEFVRALAGKGLLSSLSRTRRRARLATDQNEKMKNIVLDTVANITHRISRLKTMGSVA